MLIAGGSGLVPLMSMLRHRAASRGGVQACLLLSVRAEPDAFYTAELVELAQAGDGFQSYTTLTGSAPAGWTGYQRRVDREMLDEVSWAPSEAPRVFICGPTGFVEAVAGLLVESGHDPASIKTERFGPTGGGNR
jgi:ferredoxin-NADP reductase